MNAELQRHLHQPHVRFVFDTTDNLAEDIARIVGEHGKGCVAGAAGQCPICTLSALHAIELRLLMEG
jgi:hypothetical protein